MGTSWALTVLIVYNVPGLLGGNSMPSNKSSKLNNGNPTPETSWNKKQNKNPFLTTSYKLEVY